MKQFVLVLLFPAGLARADSPLRFEASRDAMGGTFTVVAYGADRTRLEAAVGMALEEAVRLDGLLSNYKPSSEWSRVNRQAGREAVAVSAELFHLLEACQRFSRAGEGAFDITVGPLMKTWGFYKGSGKLPHRGEVREALARIGYTALILDSAARTVRFAKPGMEIDPGGIGKGYAVDRMMDVLKAGGIRSAFLSASGSSMYGLGAPPSEPRGWRVKIRHPRGGETTVHELFLKDLSMSTSGSQEKFFRAEGKLYSHIMDPRTGYPASKGRLQVSVTAPKALDSEAWTKPLYVNDQNWGRDWAAKYQPAGMRAYICDDKKELSCGWLSPRGMSQ